MAPRLFFFTDCTKTLTQPGSLFARAAQFVGSVATTPTIRVLSCGFSLQQGQAKACTTKFSPCSAFASTICPMTPAEQVLLIMQQLPAEQQQAVVHFAQALRSTSKTAPQINHAVILDAEERLNAKRAQREMWGDDDA